MFTEIEKREFLIRLGEQFADPNKLDKAVFDRQLAKIRSKTSSLRELDAYGVFNSDGSVNQEVARQYGIVFDEGRVKERLLKCGFKHLSLREMLIFESVIATVINDLSDKTNKDTVSLQYEEAALSGKTDQKSIDRVEEILDELMYITAHQPQKGLDKESFADFWPLPSFKLTHPLSMELTGPAQQMLGMGYFKFKDTNVSISAGPHSAKSLTDPENPEQYEAQRDIAHYLNNLRTNKVAHVFAMGRVFPYYPQDGVSKSRDIIKDQTLEQDFINYFIPDTDGNVKLPDIPELKDIHISSDPIKKVGRFITYEISINGSDPIQIHHFPIRDKQPLELTPEELAYVKEVSKTTAPEKSIHTHCRGGKGRSAQIAYLLASLNPKYGQLSHDERLAQMRVEKTTSTDSMSFIETEFQKNYIEEAGYQIHEDISHPEKGANLERYVIYGALLKQEIDKYIQQKGMPEKRVNDENKEFIELMEKYQELSSIAPEDLEQWVTHVCDNTIISEQTKTLLKDIKSSGDFLLRAFKENKDPVQLKLFFDLQASHGTYQDFLSQLNLINEPPKDEKYVSLFVSHLQDAYLKNYQKLMPQEKKPLKNIVFSDISTSINRIVDEIIKGNFKTFTKEKFESLKKEYLQCKQRIELLEKAEVDDNKVLNEEFKRKSNLAEQLFNLDYEHLEVEPQQINAKMGWLYEQLSKLSSTNELNPEKWDEFKKQFTALKTIFAHTKLEDMPPPAILSTLDKIFQGKREQTENLFKGVVLQVKPDHEESLEDFVAGLGITLLEAASTELPKEYFGDDADGIYSKEINLLLEDVVKLASTYKKPSVQEKIDLSQQRKVPTQEEYEKARQQVIELIAKHTPFLISKTDLRVQFENLNQDFLRLERDFQTQSLEFRELKKRFTELKTEYKRSNSQQNNGLINQLINKIEKQIESVFDVDESNQELLAKSIQKHSESMENALKVKSMRDAVKSGIARESQDEIDYFLSSVETKKLQEVKYPKRPKLIVFDVDDTLIDLEKNELKRAEELIKVLEYAKKHGMEVALATNRTEGLDAEEKTPVAQLKKIIREKAGIDISNMLTFLETPSLRHEAESIFRYAQEKVPQLKREIQILQGQMVEAEDKESYRQKIEKIQQKIDSLETRLIAGKFTKLDSIRRHYHVLKNLSNYYQSVEGGVLQDFKNPEFTKNIGITDFIEQQKIWTDLFKLAEVLMRSDSLKDPRPSLQTILKDIIFDADKPERLQKKYGDLQQWDGLIQNIKIHKEYLRQNIPQIEVFYQSRLAAQKAKYERQDLLHEDDVLFLDDNKVIIEQTHQHSNYRAIKVSDPGEDSFRYMVDFNYEMGVYNGVIAYLNGDKANAPQSYGPDSLNKTLKSYLNDNNIPNFAKHGFQHSPIVLHVKMSTILGKLAELNPDPTIQKHYKEQFLAAAIERYNELPKELQNDFVKTYYNDTREALEVINNNLIELINSNPQLEQNVLRSQLNKLKAQLNEIIAMDEKFSQHVSATFVTPEAKLLRSMIVGGLFTGKLETLEVKENKAHFKEKHDVARVMFYTESMKQRPDIYQKNIHPVLKEMDSFDTEFITKQYQHLIEKDLKKIIDVYVRDNDPFSILNDDIIRNEYPSVQRLLEIVQDDVRRIDPVLEVGTVHRQLVAAEKLSEPLIQIAQYQNVVHDLLKEDPKVDYLQQIRGISTKIKELKNQNEKSPEYQAKLFLDKAEKYLLAKNWNVGFQWHKHTVLVDGKEKKIPATVAKQLDIIKKARESENFLEAKKDFINIGRQREHSWGFSSGVAKNYYSIFKKKDASLDKDLDNEFTSSKKFT